MAKKGGYQIIDFKNTEFSDSEWVLVPGIYNIIKSTSKTFLLTGIVYEGRNIYDCYACPAPVFNVDSGEIMQYTFGVLIGDGIYFVTCNQDDTVAITNISLQ